MSHKHAHLLETVFHDPISGNIHWREVESLLKHLVRHLREYLAHARMTPSQYEQAQAAQRAT